MKGNRALLILVAGVAMAFAPACRHAAAGAAEQPAKGAEAGPQASGAGTSDDDQTIHRIAEEARVVGRKVAKGTTYVGGKVVEGARDLSRDMREEAKDVSVKSALGRDPALDARHIEVDAHADTKTLVLRGTVPTDSQKEAAGRIAAEKAKGYRVRNLLMVADEE